MSTLDERLQEIFRDVFEDETLVINDAMSAKDIPEWDSLAHIGIIIAVERAFSIKFAVAEISGLKNPGQNIGTFKALIAGKLGAAGRA